MKTKVETGEAPATAGYPLSQAIVADNMVFARNSLRQRASAWGEGGDQYGCS